MAEPSETPELWEHVEKAERQVVHFFSQKRTVKRPPCQQGRDRRIPRENPPGARKRDLPKPRTTHQAKTPLAKRAASKRAEPREPLTGPKAR